MTPQKKHPAPTNHFVWRYFASEGSLAKDTCNEFGGHLSRSIPSRMAGRLLISALAGGQGIRTYSCCMSQGLQTNTLFPVEKSDFWKNLPGEAQILPAARL